MNLIQDIDNLIHTMDDILDNILNCDSLSEARQLLEHSCISIRNIRNNIVAKKSKTLYEIKNEIQVDSVKEEIDEELNNFAFEQNINEVVNPSPDAENSGDNPVKIMFLRGEKLTKNRQKSKGYTRCGICSKYMNSSEISKHDLTFHLKDGNYLCDLCDFKSDRRNDVVNHFSESHRSIYSCIQCDDKFHVIQDIKHHLENMHSLVFEDFQCYYCDVKYDTSPELTHHIQREHNSAIQKCYVCDKKFKFTSCLKKHLKIHDANKETFTCDKCGIKYTSKSSLELHIGRDHATSKPSIPCPHCSKMFYTQSHLSQHNSQCHGIKKFLCTLCDYQAVNKSRFNKHMLSHSDERPYPCSMCSLKFKSKVDLKKHELKVHLQPEVRNHKCNYCGKGFKHHSNLREHIKLHTGDWAATCKICDKNFAQLCNYRLHMRKNHGLDDK